MLIIWPDESNLQYYIAVTITKESKYYFIILYPMFIVILPHPNKKKENKFVLPKIYLEELSFYNSIEASEYN
jgi:hypothetical protein